MRDQIYIATGQVIDRDSNRGVKGLLVEAWDSDPQNNKLLGKMETDENGRFSINFDLAKLGLKTAPDLFFKVHREQKLIESTESSVLWNANTQENVTIKIRLTRERKPGIDWVSSEQVFKGAEFIQKSDFRGVMNDYKSRAETGIGIFADVLKKTFTNMDIKPVRVKETSHRDVVNQDVELASKNLKAKKIDVDVQPYQPSFGSLKNISALPRSLKAGQKVTLYEENGKVRYYSINETSAAGHPGKVEKQLEGQATELNKLKDDLKSAKEDAAKKDKQIISLQKELDLIREDNKAINKLIASDNFKKMIKNMGKPDKPAKPKKPNTPK